MNKFTLTLTLVALISLSVKAQWKYMNEGLKGNIRSIDFINEDVGWIAGVYGLLYKTEDGGESWDIIPVNEEWHFQIIDFINSTVAWALAADGQNDMILKTTNGGANWLLQYQVWIESFHSLFVEDENNAYVVGDWGMILSTTNGGTNWESRQFIPELEFLSVRFIDLDIGVVTGFNNEYDQALIFRTTDGGSSWEQNIVPEFSNITNLQFLNDSIGHFIASDNSGYYYICETQDTCQSWTVKTQKPSEIYSFQFLSNDTVYATMQIDDHSIFRSIDGGINWQTVQSFEYLSLYKIYFSKANSGFIIGRIQPEEYSVFITGNGEDWVLDRYAYSFNDVFFIDNNIGYYLGGTFLGTWIHGCSGSGKLFFTSDGGLTWDIKFSTGAILKTFHFIDDQTAFSLASSCGDIQIFKTIDTAITWDKVFEHNPDTAGYDLYGNDICFLNEYVGWSVGRLENIESTYSDGAIILKTMDGGANWAVEYTILDSNNIYFNFYSIFYTNNTSWTVGENGIVLKNTAESGWELQPSITDLPLNKIYFYDANNGWIAGGYINNNGFQNILLNTTDTGESWYEINNIDYLINDICFYNSDIGFAVGIDEDGNGIFLKTADGGEIWGIITIDLMGPLNSIYLKDEFGWVVGEAGQILRTTNAGATWVDDRHNKIYPTEFKLEQNYPNPFNPTTTIKYQIPKQNFVTLKIYDVLGNEIETLVNEEQPQGVYEIDYNGIRLSSGVYLYKLETDTYSQARKMILIK